MKSSTFPVRRIVGDSPAIIHTKWVQLILGGFASSLTSLFTGVTYYYLRRLTLIRDYMMSDLSDKIWWTRKAKIKAERRLLNFDYYSQLLLLWYSTFLVCYSIYTLVKPAQKIEEAAIMVSLSVLILVLTLFINNMNFKGRALLIKQCYERLSVIHTASLSPTNPSELDKEYQAVLGSSENHLEKDFAKAIVDEYFNTNDKSLLTKKTTFIHFFMIAILFLRNVASFLFLFLFPFIILFSLRAV